MLVLVRTGEQQHFAGAMWVVVQFAGRQRFVVVHMLFVDFVAASVEISTTGIYQVHIPKQKLVKQYFTYKYNKCSIRFFKLYTFPKRLFTYKMLQILKQKQYFKYDFFSKYLFSLKEINCLWNTNICVQMLSQLNRICIFFILEFSSHNINVFILIEFGFACYLRIQVYITDKKIILF